MPFGRGNGNVKDMKFTISFVPSADQDFMVEHADDFDREAAALARSEKFTRLLKVRSSESADIPIAKVCEKRGVWRRRRR